MQPWHLSLLVFITHLSSQLTYWIIQNQYRELVCVSRQWWNLQDLKSLDLAMDRAKTLAQVIWPCFPSCPQPGINLPEGWSSIPMSKCFCLAYAIDVA